MRYRTFHEFYPFYLSQHRHPTCRRLHVFGTGALLVIIAAAVATGRYGLLWILPVVGYGAAWIGHFFFERNRPATFHYPLYSLAGDFRMFFEVVAGRRKF